MAKKAAQKKADAAKNDPSDIVSTAPPNNPTKMIIADSGLAFAVYILYLFGYFTGITAIIGVIIACYKRVQRIRQLKVTTPFR